MVSELACKTQYNTFSWIDSDNPNNMNAKEEMESLSSSTSNNISRKYSVEKLTNYNYGMWKTRMGLILERANLKELVDSSMSIPK